MFMDNLASCAAWTMNKGKRKIDVKCFKDRVVAGRVLQLSKLNENWQQLNVLNVGKLHDCWQHQNPISYKTGYFGFECVNDGWWWWWWLMYSLSLVELTECVYIIQQFICESSFLSLSLGFTRDNGPVKVDESENIRKWEFCVVTNWNWYDTCS